MLEIACFLFAQKGKKFMLKTLNSTTGNQKGHGNYKYEKANHVLCAYITMP